MGTPAGNISAEVVSDVKINQELDLTELSNQTKGLRDDNAKLCAQLTSLRKALGDSEKNCEELTASFKNKERHNQELTASLKDKERRVQELTDLKSKNQVELFISRAFKYKLQLYLSELTTPQSTPLKSRVGTAAVDATATAASAIAVNLNEQFSLDSKDGSDDALEPLSPPSHSATSAGTPNSPAPKDEKETFEDMFIKRIKEKDEQYDKYLHCAYTTIEKYKKQLNKNEAQLDAYRSQIKSLTEKAKQQSTLEEQLKSLTEKAEQLSTLEEHFNALQEDNERLNVKIAKQEKKAISTIEHHLDTISSLEADIVKLRKTQDENTEALEKDLEQMRSAIKQKEDEIVDLNQAALQKQKKLDCMNSQNTNLQKKVSEEEAKLYDELAKRAATIKDITRKYQEASKELSKLRSLEDREIPQLEATIESLKQTMHNLTAQIDALTQEKCKEKDEAEHLRHQIELTSSKKIYKLTQDLENLHQEHHKCLHELQSLHEHALAAQQKQSADEQIRMQALLTQRFTALQTRFELESRKSQQELLTMFRININRKHEADIASMRSVQDRLMQENAALRMSQASESKVNAELRARDDAIEELRNRNESLMRELQSQRESVDRKSAEELRKREAEALPLLAAPVRVQTPPLQESVPALPVPVAVPVEPPQQPIQQEHEAPGPALPPPPPPAPPVVFQAPVPPPAVLFQAPVPPPAVVFQQPVQAKNCPLDGQGRFG